MSDSLECGFFSHTNIVESLEPSVWVVLKYASRERGEEVVG